MSSTLSPSATSTVANVITVTVASVAKPDPLYMDSFWGAVTTVNCVITLIGIWVAITIGFTRFSMFPIIIPGSAAIANGWFTLNIMELSKGILGFKPGSFVTTNFFWTIQSMGAVFYSYLILKRLLPLQGKHRLKVFLTGFWLLWVAAFAMRIVILTYTAITFRGLGSPHISAINNNSALAYFSLMAGIELWNAFFLLRTLFIGMRAKNAGSLASGRKIERSNLLKQIAASSEMRLATLCFVGITRACTCWNWYAKDSRTKETAGQVEHVAIILENMYPLVLIVDLLAVRATGSGSRDNSEPQQVQLEELQESAQAAAGRGRVLETVDSVKREFSKYFSGGGVPIPTSSTSRKQESDDRKHSDSKVSINSLGSIEHSNTGVSSRGNTGVDDIQQQQKCSDLV